MAEAREFRANKAYLFMAVLCYAMCAGAFIAWLRDPTGPRWWWMLLAFEILFGSNSTMVLFFALGRVSVDEEGITLRYPGWSRSLFWRELASYELGGKANGTGTLRDRGGKKLSVSYSMYVDGLILAELVGERAKQSLASVTPPEAELPICAKFENRRAIRWLCLIFVVIVIGMLVATVLLDPKRDGNIAFAAFYGSLMLALMSLLAFVATAEVELFEDRIERRMVGYRRSILLSDIREITIVEPPGRPGAARTMPVLRIRLDRRSFKWSVPLENGGVLVTKLREMLSAETTQSGSPESAQFDPAARGVLAEASAREEQDFRAEHLVRMLILSLVYVPLVAVGILLVARTAGQTPGLEPIGTGCYLFTCAFVLYVVLGIISAATLRVRISSNRILVRTLFRSRDLPWLEVKQVTVRGLRTQPSSVTLKTSHGPLTLRGLDKQWAANDLIAAHAKTHGVPVDDRTRADLPG